MLVFTAVGAVNTVICFVVYAALVELGWHYNLALFVDYGFGAIFGYALHRVATFSDRTHLRLAFGKYAVTLAIMLMVNFAVLDALVAGAWLSPLAAQAVALVVATSVSYRLQTHWVFRSHERPDSTTIAAGQEFSDRRAA